MPRGTGRKKDTILRNMERQIWQADLISAYAVMTLRAPESGDIAPMIAMCEIISGHFGIPNEIGMINPHASRQG